MALSETDKRLGKLITSMNRLVKIQQKSSKSFVNQTKAIEKTSKATKSASTEMFALASIQETINGENGFFATKILHELLQAKGLKAGAKLEITKIVNDNKTTWDVKNLGGGEVEEKSITEVIDSVANSIDASKTNKVKDLSTDQKVNIMWDAYNKKNKQPVNIGDDDLPF